MKTVAAGLLALFLCACGSDAPPAADTGAAPADSALDESAAQYQEEVRNRVADSVVSSLAKEWNVAEDKVRCLLDRVSASRLESVLTDPAVRDAFEACGVDPTVIAR